MLPDQSSEEKSTSMIDYSYNPYSPASYPISTKKRKRVVKKEKVEKKPKTKKIKQEPEGKTFHEVPAVVENGEIVEVQVLQEGKIFDPDVLLDGLALQCQPLPPSTPQTSTEPFRNPSPPTREYRISVLLPCASKWCFTKERDQLSVRPLGVLQVPRPKLFCQLRCRQCRALLRLGQTSTPQLLPGQTRTHHEMLL